MIMKYFGWKRVAVIYETDRSDQQELYEAMKNVSQKLGINITNSEHLRGVAQGVSRGVTAELNASLTEIIQSTVRVVMILHSEIGDICEAMYDLGVRSKYVIIGATTISLTAFNSKALNYDKRRVVAKGAIRIATHNFIGKTGQRVLRELQRRDGNNFAAYSCLSYDSVMLYLLATEYMIERGIGYESPYEIMKAMRGTHFQGCSGLMSISSGSNNRASAEMSVSNLKSVDGNKSISLDEVLYYNPFSVVLFKEVGTIVWPDNSTGVFLDTFVSSLDCPFLESQIRDFPAGRYIEAAAAIFTLVLSAVVAFIVWIKSRQVRYQTIVSRTELSADDVVQMAVIPLEAFQLAAIGPKSKSLSNAVSGILQRLTLQLDTVVGASGSRFWQVLYITFGFLGWYLLVCAIKLTNVEKKLDVLPLWSLLMLFANLLLPSFSSLLFVPVTSTILQLFRCHESIGDSFASSFLDRDCYTFCWTGVHLPLAFCGAVALVLFIPLATITWPIWQEKRTLLHIKVQPQGLAVKTVFYVLLVSLNYTLKDDFPDIHAAIFLFLLLSYTAFIVWFPLYNYNRLSMWAVIGVVSVISFSAISFGSQHYPKSSLICLCLLISCQSLYVAVGIVLQACAKRFKSMFFRRKMKTKNIIYFAFTFGSRARHFLESHFNDSYFSEDELRTRRIAIPHY